MKWKAVEQNKQFWFAIEGDSCKYFRRSIHTCFVTLQMRRSPVLAFDLRYIIRDLKHIYLIWPVTNGWKKWMVFLPTNTKVACPAMFLALGSGGISMEVSGGGATTIMISDISPWLPPGARCRLNWPSFGEERALGLIYWITVYV